MAYQEPRRSNVAFWGDLGHPLGLRCLHCHTKWAETGYLFRHQETWNALFYGLFISISAALVIWLLPYKLLPWSTNVKWGITILCSLSAGSVLIQVLQRNRRLYALRQFGYLGSPANVLVPSEVSRSILQQLEGKSKSIDGALKAKLLPFVAALQKRAIPPLLHAKHALALFEQHSFESIRKKVRYAGLELDEKMWAEQRLSWLQNIDENHKQWIMDVRLSTDLLETIVSDLESLAMGDKEEKAEARKSLQLTLQEGEELLERVACLSVPSLQKPSHNNETSQTSA